ncbi:hypothetical protein [Mycobacterium intracellulare]|uniref:hypothetical protein n=1 Tax=Mycobacterium intracellulare TaxID=1767 RepID=UPI0025975919|nr:hypothetical protein [Mycobacterium intracellulare]MDM3894736.1 hypothetical protein [Mycobacterium intracellulare]
MAGTYSIHPNVALAMLQAFATQLGNGAKIKFYNGTMPASAAAALSGNTLLLTLAASATPISGYSDTGTAKRATWAAIASAAVAATGTAAFYRVEDSAGNVIEQGKVGLSGDNPTPDIVLSTTAFTAGSTGSLTAKTNDFPYGP